MLDLMLDLETMGRGPTGAIVAIGAVFFDERSGELGPEFYRAVNLATAVRDGGEITPDTVMWWLGQDVEARNAILFNTCDIAEVLGEFSNFIESRVNTAEVRVWGCSPSFDCTKVETAMQRIGMKAPWRYYNERCYRTIRDRNPSVEQDEREGLHNALEDAKYQARHLIKIRKANSARKAAA